VNPIIMYDILGVATMKFYQDISCNFSNISNAAIRGILMSVIHYI